MLDHNHAFIYLRPLAICDTSPFVTLLIDLFFFFLRHLIGLYTPAFVLLYTAQKFCPNIV